MILDNKKITPQELAGLLVEENDKVQRLVQAYEYLDKEMAIIKDENAALNREIDLLWKDLFGDSPCD